MDLDSGVACVEHNLRESCVVGDSRRRNKPVSVVGGGRCNVAWSRVSFCRLRNAFSSEEFTVSSHAQLSGAKGG